MSRSLSKKGKGTLKSKSSTKSVASSKAKNKKSSQSVKSSSSKKHTSTSTNKTSANKSSINKANKTSANAMSKASKKQSSKNISSIQNQVNTDIREAVLQEATPKPSISIGGDRMSPVVEQMSRLLEKKKAGHVEKNANRMNFSTKAKVKIIPLGGLGQIGMNITAFEYKNTIIVVDCGMAFPSEDMPGIDLVIPDVTYLKNNISKLKGYFITHGHEDHIGAIPYIIKEANAPIYATKLTTALIEHKIVEHGLTNIANLNIIKHGETVTAGDFKIEFVKTNHSISDSSALAIFTPAGIIFHTGDFKIDYTPVFGEAADLQRMAEIGKQGVLALLCDSTNAAKPGFTMSEKTVGKTFDTIFADHQDSRIIVATFASNVDRVQQIVNTAHKYGRKVVVEGRSMVTVITLASELGYIKIPDGTIINVDNLGSYPQEKTVIITTGSQGESMAALSRMASSTHKKISIQPTDVVILSSHPIPGNEKSVARVINELSAKGAEVLFQDTHVSGHACAEEIKLMYSLLRPKYALPVHGEDRHLKAQKAIAQAVGVPKENITIMEVGDIVEISQKSCEIIGREIAGARLVDGLGIGDVGNVVLHDRQNLAQNGVVIVALTLDGNSKNIVAGPDIVSRGFIYMKESEEFIEEAREVVEHALENALTSGVSDWSRLKTIIKDSLGDFVWKRMKRDPLILPIIMKADI